MIFEIQFYFDIFTTHHRSIRSTSFEITIPKMCIHNRTHRPVFGCCCLKPQVFCVYFYGFLVELINQFGDCLQNIQSKQCVFVDDAKSLNSNFH